MPSQLSLDLLLSDDAAKERASKTEPPCSPEEAFGLAADILSGKWTAQIIRELLTGTKRYSQLQSALHGVSPKMLTARLRRLEAENLITRKVYATVPPKTEYRLTELGYGLESFVTAMTAFGGQMALSRTSLN